MPNSLDVVKSLYEDPSLIALAPDTDKLHEMRAYCSHECNSIIFEGKSPKGWKLIDLIKREDWTLLPTENQTQEPYPNPCSSFTFYP
jgi:hypothetical protein